LGYLLTALIGMIAGLRTMTAPAAASWAAWTGALDLGGTWLAFLGLTWTPWVITLLAVGELVNDKLPGTPSRKVPVQFAARVLSGLLAGAAFGTAAGGMAVGAAAGGAGAVLGTLGGAWARGRLAAAFGKDLPAALVEDAVAVAGAALLVLLLP
jgi:uncharacterized membrane protein